MGRFGGRDLSRKRLDSRDVASRHQRAGRTCRALADPFFLVAPAGPARYYLTTCSPVSGGNSLDDFTSPTPPVTSPAPVLQYSDISESLHVEVPHVEASH